MTGVLTQREKLDAGTHTHTGRTPYEDVKRDPDDASMHQRTPELANKAAEAGERLEQIAPSQPQKEPIQGNTLILDF